MGERTQSGEPYASERCRDGGETVAMPEKETFLREETGKTTTLELQGKACRTYWESGEIIYNNEISKARGMAELAS